MSPELDEGLVVKYPKIFKNRYGSMQETCMMWGFENGDGWHTIIDNACSLIQSHIDWTRKSRAGALRYNRALSKALNGDQTALINYYSPNDKIPTDRTYIIVDKALADSKFREVPNACSQVTANQIKEKFGTLRFYYSGGDDYVDGIVRMAESMTAVTCEECGAPGTTGGRGWISTLCEVHRKES